MAPANGTKKIRVVVGLTGLLSSTFFALSLFAFYQSSKSEQELAIYKEQHRLLIEEYQDLSQQIEQLRSAHASIEKLLKENRQLLSISEEARIQLEKKKFQDQLEAIEEKQNYIRLRQKLWTTIRERLSEEIESNMIAMIRKDDQFIIRIPNEHLFIPASVDILKPLPIETATPIQDATVIENPANDAEESSPQNEDEIPSNQEPLLSPAESLLNKVAYILKYELPEIPILVEGHTDNVPIGSALRDQFPSNWELSSARATAAVRYLQQVGGVSPNRMTAVGRADTAPVAENVEKKGNKKNRRVDIIIQLNEQSLPTLFEPPSTTSPPETVS